MTDASAYRDLIDGIFGVGACKFVRGLAATNPLLAILSEVGEDNRLRHNFEARLRRLEREYREHKSRVPLLTRVSEIANPSNWQGAFAELSAVDLFCSTTDFLFEAPALDVTMPADESLASRFGRKAANLDVDFGPLGMFTDVKVLKDNVSEIMERIYREVWPKGRPLIHHEYPMDASFELLESNRLAILERIKAAVGDGSRPSVIDLSGVVPELLIRVKWEGGVLVTHSLLDPFRHAQETHRLPFLHAKKFATGHPFFLTFVLSPLFNRVIDDFAGMNTAFYRALSRRVFCQYRGDKTRFADWSRGFRGSETVHEVSRYLGGVLFLEDGSTQAANPSEINVKGFYYENPNAHHLPSRGIGLDYLREIVDHFDLFRFDNY